MLRVGLTGGIGAGKSTIARRMIEHGAVHIDADRIAREVVEPGTEGLAELAAAFGSEIVDSAGALDRSVLARRVFAEDAARQRMNEILHPRIAARTEEYIARVSPSAIVVHDVPLLVENGLAPNYHLVVVVDAPGPQRIERLVARGVSERDARARMDAQATTEQRAEVADVWLDNSRSEYETFNQIDALWTERIVPYEANIRLRREPEHGPARLIAPDPWWPRQARRVTARLSAVLGKYALRVDHVGSTSVPGLEAKDILDLQVTVASMTQADALADVLGDAGFPLVSSIDHDNPKAGITDPGQWVKRFHVSADPQRPVNVHLRQRGCANWRYALLFPAWLRADEQARDEYARLKRELAQRYAGEATYDNYTLAKEPWFDEALPRAENWAIETNWSP